MSKGLKVIFMNAFMSVKDWESMSAQVHEDDKS